MNIGYPVRMEIEPDIDDRSIDVSLYDENGLTNGGITIFPNGNVSWALVGQDGKIIGKGQYKAGEES